MQPTKHILKCLSKFILGILVLWALSYGEENPGGLMSADEPNIFDAVDFDAVILGSEQDEGNFPGGNRRFWHETSVIGFRHLHKKLVKIIDRINYLRAIVFRRWTPWLFTQYCLPRNPIR